LPETFNFDLYFSSSSARHIDVRSKLFSLACFSVCLFFIESLIGILFAILLFAVVFLLAKIPAKYIFVSVWPIYILAAITLLFSCLNIDFVATNPSQIVAFNIANLPGAIVVFGRFLLSVWASMLFCLTTSPTDVTFAVSWILRPLQRFKLPVDDVSMVVSIAIRFIPLAISEFCDVRDSMLMRGAMLYRGGIIERMRAWCSVLVAFLIGMFRRADTLAQSLDVRGYGAFGCRRTTVREYIFNIESWVFGFAVGIYMIAVSMIF
jgi:energy-coupling factor transport system permease protein